MDPIVSRNKELAIICIKAMFYGHDDACIQLINQYKTFYDTYIDHNGYIGINPLIGACIYDKADIAHLLIVNGCDLRRCNYNDENILIFACRYDRISIVKDIIKTGHIDINTRGEYGQTPLSIMCIDNCLDIITEFLNNGANVNCVNIYGDTPLMYAVKRYGNEGTIIELIRRGADVNILNKSKSSALSLLASFAQYNGDKYILLLIEAGAHFVDHIDNIRKCKYTNVLNCIANKYKTAVIDTIDDMSSDNALYCSFRTTYAVGLVDIICGYVV
ncbi:MAG: hypothetical protein Faunusvirus18_6 [Faunusvirus sp.]|jgi:ankyrin repeat protein|uniref:Uncharacterized protein n=1 Tax=Faunusvirus sp. TaxID=2487766 RepID=A0A3G4ZZQ6_9VIRU|nr:MAG: hypothetical protein Faunusvirus18_6 [Faunusvirus sp.]